MDGARPKHDGFTLLELLFTIAIIAVLATLTVSAVVKARATARTVQCLNNLKQHGVALHSFVQDHSVYPLVINPGFKLGIEPEHYSSLWVALTNYGLGPLQTTGKGVHVCPAAALQKAPQTNGSRSITGYGYNAHGLGKRLENPPLGLAGMVKVGQYLVSPVPESEVANPSGMIAMADGVRGWNNTYEDGMWLVARSSDATEYAGSNERVAQRHRRRLMNLFADGHVVAISLRRLFEDQNDDALAMWNRDGLPHRERNK